MLAADAAAMLRSIQGIVGIRFVTALGSLTCRQSAVFGLQPAGAHHFEQTREVKQQATEARDLSQHQWVQHLSAPKTNAVSAKCINADSLWSDH